MKSFLSAVVLALFTLPALAHHEQDFKIEGAGYNRDFQSLDIRVDYAGCGGIADFDYWATDCMKSNPPQVVIAIQKINPRNARCGSTRSKANLRIPIRDLACTPAVVHVMKEFDGSIRTHRGFVYSVSIR